MYHVTFSGLTPLLMHADNVEWADQMDTWKAENQRKKSRGETADDSKAGDDRTPALEEHRAAGRRIRRAGEIVRATDRAKLSEAQQKTHDMVAVQTADQLRRSRMLTRTATVELHGTPRLPSAGEAATR